MKNLFLLASRTAALLFVLVVCSCASTSRFAIGDESFRLDGEPFVIRCGEMHAAHDYAQVFLNGERLAILDRRHDMREVHLPATAEGELEVLVEAFGRINYGRDIHDRKGIIGEVTLDGESLTGFAMQQLPLDDDFLVGLRFEPCTQRLREPVIYRGTFVVEEPGDTFLDLRTWHKGAVWVNGHALGRYWNLGPQQTLYLPGCWLREGENEILVLDVTGDARELAVPGRDRPILDQLGHDPLAPVSHRRPGQELDLEGLQPVHTGAFVAGADWQAVHFAVGAATAGRYVCLEALDSQAGDPFTSCAELKLLGPGGIPLPRDGWKVLYADSEELDGDAGAADRVLDGRADTFWHTAWRSASPAHPHRLVIDLGAERTVVGLCMLPRQDSPNGRIGRFRLFVTRSPFAGL